MLSLLSKTLSPHAYICTTKDAITVFFREYIYGNSHFHCFISHKYPFVEVIQNRYFCLFREIFKNTFFNRTTSNECFRFFVNLLFTFICICFKTDQNLLNSFMAKVPIL